MKFRKIIGGIGWYLLVVLAAILLGFTLYLRKYFTTVSMEQLLYNFLNMDSLNIVSIYQSVSSVVFFAILFLAIFSIPYLIPCFTNKKFKILIFGKEIVWFPIPYRPFSIFVLGSALILFFLQIRIIPFIRNQLLYSNLYEEYYVPYESEKVQFPEKKQNLITIYVESFENSVFLKNNGGTVMDSYAPNIERLAMKGAQFSNTDKLGGFRTLKGTNWTIAGIVAQTAGIPIYIQTKNEEDLFLEGATTLGDILEENGYQNYFMLGSNADFAERRKYFTEHGNYMIYDYDMARIDRQIPFDYFVWWGYEDSKLYEYAKKDLLSISKKEEPFNFTILTADTHFPEGYTDESCPKKFASSYANSYYCMDQMLSAFIEWLKIQDFYQDTTVVIVGDHLTMRDDFFKRETDYERTVFNLFLNSRVESKYMKNRDFTAFDMFPTILASLGVSIDGERLALGTNLFSGKKTLAEELGYEEFASILQKKSKYYSKEILKER